MKALVEGKGSFSAGGQWCAMGFKLLGSRALVKAQVLQVQKEKNGTAEAIAKKVEEKREKLNNAIKAMELYKSDPNKLKSTDWQDIMKFLLPIFDKKTAPSKLSSKVKVIAKLEEIEKKNDKAWLLLLEEEVAKAQAGMAQAVTEEQADGLNWGKYCLDEGSDCDGEDEEVECIGEEAAL